MRDASADVGHSGDQGSKDCAIIGAKSGRPDANRRPLAPQTSPLPERIRRVDGGLPGKGIEPLRPYEHSALNAACLPVPPPRRAQRWYQPELRITALRRAG